MPDKALRRWWTIGAVLFVTTLLSLLYWIDAFGALQAQLTDRFFTRSEAPTDIILVVVDEPTLEQVGQWPFARSTHAQLLGHLNTAAVVGFDVIFSEPSALGAVDDQALAEAVDAFGGEVVLAQVLEEQSGLLIDPIQELATSTTLGYVNTASDRDGVVRRVSLERSGAQSFDAAILATYAGLESDTVDRMVYYYGPERTFTTFSYVDVLNRSIPAELFTGKVVLVGASAAGLGDTFQTPFGAMPGVEIHANTIASVLQQKHIEPVSKRFGLLVLLLIAVFVYVTVSVLQKAWQLLLGAVVIFAAILIDAYLAFSFGYIFPHFYEILLFVVLFGVLLLVQYIFANREKAFIRNGFSQYVAKEVVDELANDPSKLTLGGETKTLSILFSDIRGFTTISEQLTPQQLMTQLNEYLEEMSEAVMNNHGVVDKYIGDAVMAFWGAPLPNMQHAVHACESVIAMMEALQRLNEQWAAEGKPAFAIGVGISTGDVVVGNMGSNRRFNYSIIGDEVNFSARIEGLTKQYGVACILGEGTYRAIKDSPHLHTRELDDVMVKGKKEPRRIYELITGDMTETKQRVIECFSRGRQRYIAGDFSAAIALFDEALAIDPNDGPSKVFKERAAQLRDNPPSDWNGVFEFTTK